MGKIWTMGEMLVEIMRPGIDIPLNIAGVFHGPYPSGAPAIFIDTVARMGHSAGIIGGVGRDGFGKCLLERLKYDGVDCSFVTEYDSGSTGVAFVTYFSDGSREFIYHFPDTVATRPKAPKAHLLGNEVSFFHIMGCSIMAKQEFGKEILMLMQELSANGTKISFDPNIRAELMKEQSFKQMIDEVMTHCNVLLPGVSELLTITEKNTLEDAVAACFENPNLEIIAVKDGSKGCKVYTRNSSFTMGVYPVEVKDPTGAGDCFDAAFLCGIMENNTLREAAQMATAAAALNTAAFGPMEGNINRDAIEKMISEHKSN